MSPEEGGRTVQFYSKLGTAVLYFLIALTLVLAALSVLAGFYTMFFTTLTAGLGASTQFHLYFWIGPLALLTPFSLPAGGIFVAMTAAYVFLFVVAALAKAPPSEAATVLPQRVLRLLSSDLAVAAMSIGFLTFTATIADQLTSAAGVPIGGLATSDFSAFLSASTAPLTEEFGFRVCIIGTVAVLLSMGRTPREMLRALWRPSVSYEGLALRSDRVTILAVALVASSVAFGIQHVVGGSGWGVGKLPEATWGGLVLGYVYVKYGFHVAVLAHWGIDYLGSAFAFFGQGAYGVSWGSDPGIFLQRLVVGDLLAGIGLASFLLVIYVGAVRIKRRSGTGPMPHAGSS